MPPAPASPQPDPRREQLRRQAIQRRQAVLDRIAGTRTVLIGGVIVVSCVLAGYLDANAHPRASTTGTASTGFGSGSSGSTSSNYGGGTSQSLLGGGSPPTASSGGGSVVSGGS